MAKDKATHNEWARHPKKGCKHRAEDPENLHSESLTYYNNIPVSEPYAFYHRAVPVKGIRILIDRTN